MEVGSDPNSSGNQPFQKPPLAIDKLQQYIAEKVEENSPVRARFAALLKPFVAASSSLSQSIQATHHKLKGNQAKAEIHRIEAKRAIAMRTERSSEPILHAEKEHKTPDALPIKHLSIALDMNVITGKALATTHGLNKQLDRDLPRIPTIHIGDELIAYKKGHFDKSLEEGKSITAAEYHHLLKQHGMHDEAILRRALLLSTQGVEADVFSEVNRHYSSFPDASGKKVPCLVNGGALSDEEKNHLSSDLLKKQGLTLHHQKDKEGHIEWSLRLSRLYTVKSEETGHIVGVIAATLIVNLEHPEKASLILRPISIHSNHQQIS